MIPPVNQVTPCELIQIEHYNTQYEKRNIMLCNATLRA